MGVKKNKSKASFEDINGDDYQDLVEHIGTQQLELNEGDTRAYLVGETYNGVPIISKGD
jgi:hypothetical protein